MKKKQIEVLELKNKISKIKNWGIPGDPAVRTLRFHCREAGFSPWSGNKDPASHAVRPRKGKKRN